MSTKRYKVFSHDGFACDAPSDSGEWVRYTDHIAEMEQMKDLIAQYKEIEASWDTQEVGNLLGIRWGECIRPQVAPKIRECLAEIERLRDILGESHRLLVALKPFADKQIISLNIAKIEAALARNAADEG